MNDKVEIYFSHLTWLLKFMKRALEFVSKNSMSIHLTGLICYVLFIIYNNYKLNNYELQMYRTLIFCASNMEETYFLIFSFRIQYCEKFF